MKKLPFIIFLAFVAGALVTSIGSYKATEYRICQDVQQALTMTMQELSCDKIDMDTIRCYRSHESNSSLTIEPERGKTYRLMG